VLFSSVVSQMLGHDSQRRGRAVTSQIRRTSFIFCMLLLYVLYASVSVSYVFLL
jgi:hypothetical protein